MSATKQPERPPTACYSTCSICGHLICAHVLVREVELERLVQQLVDAADTSSFPTNGVGTPEQKAWKVRYFQRVAKALAAAAEMGFTPKDGRR